MMLSQFSPSHIPWFCSDSFDFSLTRFRLVRLSFDPALKFFIRSRTTPVKDANKLRTSHERCIGNSRIKSEEGNTIPTRSPASCQVFWPAHVIYLYTGLK